VRDAAVSASGWALPSRGQPESSLIVTLATAAWLAYRRPALRTAALGGGALVLAWPWPR